jgi:rhodanese-related sulfurtransferase
MNEIHSFNKYDKCEFCSTEDDTVMWGRDPLDLHIDREARECFSCKKCWHKRRNSVPFITNVSMKDVIYGTHKNAGDNSLLISIRDVGVEAPVPMYKFKEIRRYVFSDATKENHNPEWDKLITPQEAASLVEDLVYALENRMNVVVHCYAGICRSGAVATIGGDLGFDFYDNGALPNPMVSSLMWQYIRSKYPNLFRM